MRKQFVFQEEKTGNPQSQAENIDDERQGADNMPGTGMLKRPVSLAGSSLFARLPQLVQSFSHFSPTSIDYMDNHRQCLDDFTSKGNCMISILLLLIIILDQ